jgi:hypothetical protein
MSVRTWIFVVLSVGLLFLACEKLETAKRGEYKAGPLKFETSEFTDAIPLEYGKLVGVTMHPQSSHWAALWFQAEDSTISVVWVNVVEKRIQEDVLKIPRR